jgi:hypothetical protein
MARAPRARLCVHVFFARKKSAAGAALLGSCGSGTDVAVPDPDLSHHFWQ